MQKRKRTKRVRAGLWESCNTRGQGCDSPACNCTPFGVCLDPSPMGSMGNAILSTR